MPKVDTQMNSNIMVQDSISNYSIRVQYMELELVFAVYSGPYSRRVLLARQKKRKKLLKQLLVPRFARFVGDVGSRALGFRAWGIVKLRLGNISDLVERRPQTFPPEFKINKVRV